MKAIRQLLLPLLAVFVILQPSISEACTSILVSRGASADGSVIITYACDGEFHPHLRYVPAADYEPGARKEIRHWDGSLVGEVGPTVMGQRDELAQSGFVTAVARYDRKAGKIVGKPRIITHGFVYVPDAEDLLSRAEEVVRDAASVKGGTAPRKVEEKVERALSSFLYRETKRKPVVTAALTKA